MYRKLVKLFLRLAISLSFLSAVADRLGMWNAKVSVWGNWNAFISYTEKITPWFPTSILPFLGITATVAEVVFAFCLLIGLRTELFAKLSGILLLIFALSMTFSTGIKTAFDASVYSASAAAFALGFMKVKFLEIDNILFPSGKSKYRFRGFKY